MIVLMEWMVRVNLAVRASPHLFNSGVKSFVSLFIRLQIYWRGSAIYGPTPRRKRKNSECNF
jgi:hypothetical protein